MAKKVTKTKQEARYLTLGKVFCWKNANYSYLFPPSMRADKIEDADVVIYCSRDEEKRDRHFGTIIYPEHQANYIVTITHVITQELVGHASSESGWYNINFNLPLASGFESKFLRVIKDCIASIVCPACGNSFYLSDSTCPNCGHIIPEAELQSARKTILEQNRQFLTERYQEKKKRHKKSTTIFLILLPLGIVAILTGVLMNLQGVENYHFFLFFGGLSTIFGLIFAIDIASSKKRLKNFKKALI